ncbi:CD82 antigen-like [Xyrauchen texanus]|uniref:CD82 antigen-like n=1 Tax=Xyrauchen texanus TaxID=154827 RepID=UPI002241E53C|nr:CD82 antigen-like [Xyrauchen texanus]
MKADEKLQILKFFLMLINSFFVILGISIFACSAWIFFDKDNFISVISSGKEVKLVAGGLFVIGLVVVGVSLLGCIGACLENRCFIIFYLSFLIATILGQIFITLVLLIQQHLIESYLMENVDEIIVNYGGNKTQTSWRLLDRVQNSAKCCGRVTPNEWMNNIVIWSLSGTDIYPCSCFNGTCPVILTGTHSFGNGSNIYKMGCEEVLGNWLDMNIIVIFGMDGGLLLIQVLQFIFGIYAYKCIGRKRRELHSGNLLNAMEESPSMEPFDQQCNTETHQHEFQTYNPQTDSGYYHDEYDLGKYDHAGYDHSSYNPNGYIAENYDQYNNHEFFEQGDNLSYNNPQILQYTPSYNGSYDQRYVQNYPQNYNGDDY